MTKSITKHKLFLSDHVVFVIHHLHTLLIIINGSIIEFTYQCYRRLSHAAGVTDTYIFPFRQIWKINSSRLVYVLVCFHNHTRSWSDKDLRCDDWVILCQPYLNRNVVHNTLEKHKIIITLNIKFNLNST